MLLVPDSLRLPVDIGIQMQRDFPMSSYNTTNPYIIQSADDL
jgi:hypothetical protein